jgi:post-segregation antitoxin (ccd killing protein)
MRITQSISVDVEIAKLIAKLRAQQIDINRPCEAAILKLAKKNKIK